MENAIAIRTDLMFKEKALNDAVKGLSKAFTNIDKNRKDACIILWRLEDGKKYEADGFKSLQEFAETIGIDKSSAHKMADAGRLYDSHNPAIAQFADKAGYTSSATIASLAKSDEGKLAESIEAGEITPDMTVSDLKSWKATKLLQEKPEKVVPNWTMRISSLNIIDTESGLADWSTEVRVVGIADPADFAREYDESAIVAKAKGEDGCTIYLALCADGSMFNYTAVKVKKAPKEKPAVKSIKDMTDDEFEAEIARLKALRENR